MEINKSQIEPLK